MRWIWIDKFIEFESGQRAKSVKNVSLAEEHLHDHFPGYPVMPNSLITEGLAQTGGVLVGETTGFKELVVLAKIPKAVYHFPAVAGDTLIYSTQIESLKEDGACVSATSTVNGRVQAEMEIFYAFLSQQDRGSAMEAKNFVQMLRLLGVLNFGTAPDGTPLPIPKGLARLQELASE
ncbi:MAG TPA: 3-hydroxyacyl-ACP dehydratase FabZ family protein [Pirellulales bacterium]